MSSYSLNSKSSDMYQKIRRGKRERDVVCGCSVGNEGLCMGCWG